MKRIARNIIGFALLVLGGIMLVAPGPGWVVIGLGLAALAADFPWARRLLSRLKEQGIRIRNAVLRTSSPKPER